MKKQPCVISLLDELDDGAPLVVVEPVRFIPEDQIGFVALSDIGKADRLRAVVRRR
jgi:hypothetical protein